VAVEFHALLALISWKSTHCIGGWVDFTASLKAVVKRKVRASGIN
jgi:hypothetical protein